VLGTVVVANQRAHLQQKLYFTSPPPFPSSQQAERVLRKHSGSAFAIIDQQRHSRYTRRTALADFFFESPYFR
jgi:hypothetical protein